MLLIQRIIAKLRRHGEAFTVNGSSYYGAFKLLDSGTMRNYLSDTEIMGVDRPSLVLTTEPGANININNTLVREGRTYTVLRVSNQRIGGVTVAKTAILG